MTGVVNIKESNLSNMPPWPINRREESFIFTLRFKDDSKMSPKNPIIFSITINTHLSMSVRLNINLSNKNINNTALINPPIKPEYVLFGLIDGAIYLPPIHLPKIYEKESFTETPANNINVK